MKTVCKVEDMAALAKLLDTTVRNLSVEPYGNGIDPRNGWHTHIVAVKGCAVGFTDGPVKP